MGYKAFIVVNLIQEFKSEYVPGVTFNIPTYNNSYITNNQGFVVGTIRTQSSYPVHIPGHDETWLHTVCVPILYMLEDFIDINRTPSYKAILTYEIYKRYRGGKVEKVLEKIVNASLKRLFKSKKRGR